MITRLGIYRRWRRFVVTSLIYPLLLVVLVMGAAGVVFWVSLLGV